MDPTGRYAYMFEEDWCNKKRPNMKYPGNLKTGNVETKLSNFFLFSNLNWYSNTYTVLHSPTRVQWCTLWCVRVQWYTRVQVAHSSTRRTVCNLYTSTRLGVHEHVIVFGITHRLCRKLRKTTNPQLLLIPGQV
jgi:hypothetical protein